MLRYFNYSEFDSPDVQGSGQLMDKTLLEMLDEVRENSTNLYESIVGLEHLHTTNLLAVRVIVVTSKDLR